jgi:hypothetical protein
MIMSLEDGNKGIESGAEASKEGKENKETLNTLNKNADAV